MLADCARITGSPINSLYASLSSVDFFLKKKIVFKITLEAIPSEISRSGSKLFAKVMSR